MVRNILDVWRAFKLEVSSGGSDVGYSDTSVDMVEGLLSLGADTVAVAAAAAHASTPISGVRCSRAAG